MLWHFNFSDRNYSVYKLHILLYSLQIACVCTPLILQEVLFIEHVIQNGLNLRRAQDVKIWICLNVQWYVLFLSGWYFSHSQVWSFFTYVTVFQSIKEHNKENTGCPRSCLTKMVKYLTAYYFNLYSVFLFATVRKITVTLGLFCITSLSLMCERNLHS